VCVLAPLRRRVAAVRKHKAVLCGCLCMVMLIAMIVCSVMNQPIFHVAAATGGLMMMTGCVTGREAIASLNVSVFMVGSASPSTSSFKEKNKKNEN
jgi:hypothetical protein